MHMGDEDLGDFVDTELVLWMEGLKKELAGGALGAVDHWKGEQEKAREEEAYSRGRRRRGCRIREMSSSWTLRARRRWMCRGR